MHRSGSTAIRQTWSVAAAIPVSTHTQTIRSGSSSIQQHEHQQQQQHEHEHEHEQSMGMGMSVRMSTACSMHSIARNSTCRAWHGSRAQHDHSIENANATGGLRAKHKEVRTTKNGTKMHKMHACAQAIHNSNAGQRATATQPVSQSVIANL